MRLYSFLALCGVFLLSGCAITQRTVYIAPELVQYSKEEQNKVADEIEACGDGCKQLTRFIGDYGNLREAIRQTSTNSQ